MQRRRGEGDAPPFAGAQAIAEPIAGRAGQPYAESAENSPSSDPFTTSLKVLELARLRTGGSSGHRAKGFAPGPLGGSIAL